MSDDCIFCKIARKEIPAEFIEEGDNFFVINDANPVSEGHCLIIPKTHFEDVLGMPSLHGNELIKLIKSQILRLKKDGLADGAKVVQNNGASSGQTVFHYHLHVVPEKDGVSREKHV